jgi:predicted adenylyl cyclase CyaB
MGELGRVRKRRLLFLVGQTRVHIDTVERLGDFLELEVVLRPQQSQREGETIANDLMFKLGVSPDQLISCAYMDLILQQSSVSFQ